MRCRSASSPANLTLFTRTRALCFAAAALLCAPAWSDEAGTIQARFEIDAWPARYAAVEHGARHDTTRPGDIDTSLWVGRAGSRFGFGLGAARYDASQAGPFDTARGGAASAIVGLRYELPSGLRFTLASTAPSLSGSGAAESRLRLGLDLKPARNPRRFSRGTLFRAQLDQTTQISLRVRSRGLRLVLRSEF